MLWGKASLNFLFVPWNSPACAHGNRRGPQGKEEERDVGKDTEFFWGPVYPVVFPGRPEDRKTPCFKVKWRKDPSEWWSPSGGRKTWEEGVAQKPRAEGVAPQGSVVSTPLDSPHWSLRAGGLDYRVWLEHA